MKITWITEDNHFQTELLSHGSKLIIVDFTASWCMPCKRISPFFDEMAAKYDQAVFLKVDVNVCEETASAQGVMSMPTFLFYKNTKKVDSLTGADPKSLEAKIKQHYSTGHGIEPAPGQVDLVGFVLQDTCKALNESDEHPFTDCLTLSPAYLESDCDEQLILPVIFNQAVKIHSLKILAPPEKGPKILRLFINQPYPLDFARAGSNTPLQEVEVSKEELEGNPVNLNYVKFQNVQNLYVFVKNNQSGTETTRIDYFQVIGSPVISVNMNDFKRVVGKVGEAH
uniref:Thioredoxin domain-containing protein n=1 Tax=Clastoptera arizonana TaxID=38151 RepID=A0A1B6CCK4_9HEMI